MESGCFMFTRAKGFSLLNIIFPHFYQCKYNNLMKKSSAEQKLNPEQIIGYCQQTFINIIPTPTSHPHPCQPLPVSLPQPSHPWPQTEKQALRTIMKQLSIFLQLTIQNCVLTSDPKIKSLSFKILSDFRDYLS